MDARLVRTQKNILEAFKKLIKVKKYKDITIQDILNEGNIGRATFYDHYKTKDAVLKAICTDIIEHVSGVQKKEEGHDFSFHSDFRHRIIHMLIHFKNDYEIMNGILSSEAHDIFIECFNIKARELIYAEVLNKYECFDIPEDLLVNHLTSTLLETILWWITENKCQSSPETTTRYYMTLILPLLTEKDEA